MAAFRDIFLTNVNKCDNNNFSVYLYPTDYVREMIYKSSNDINLRHEDSYDYEKVPVEHILNICNVSSLYSYLKVYNINKYGINIKWMIPNYFQRLSILTSLQWLLDSVDRTEETIVIEI